MKLAVLPLPAVCLTLATIAGVPGVAGVLQGAQFDFGSNGTLSVEVPEGWAARRTPGPGAVGGSVTVSIQPADGHPAKCLLTLFPAPELTREELRRQVLRMTGPMVAESVEKQQTLRDFSPREGFGAYCVFTDASLVGKPSAPGDYKVMGSGMVRLAGRLVGTVSLFADTADGADLKAMVGMVNTLELGPARAPSEAEGLVITPRGTNWQLTAPRSRLELVIPQGGLSQITNTPRGAAASARYFQMANKASGLILSGWFESEDKYPGMTRFWQEETNSWNRQRLLRPVDVSFLKTNGWEIVSYDHSVPLATNSHVRAHWVEAGTWIDLHLSMTAKRSSAECQRDLLSLLNQIQVKRRE